PPSPRHLDRGFDRLRARVHGDDHLHAAQPREVAAEGLQVVGAVRAAGQGQLGQLTTSGGDEAGVTVSEVQRRVGREEVQVAVTMVVLDPRSAPARQRHRQRVVVRRAVPVGRSVATDPHARQPVTRHRNSNVQHLTPPPALTNSDISTGTGSNPRVRTRSCIPTAATGSTTWWPSLTALSPSEYASASPTRIASGKSRSSTQRVPAENAGG